MTSELLPQLVALVAVCAAVAYVGQRLLRLVPLVGFLLAGVLIGPHALGLVHDLEVVEGAAELGVVLLLFTIGIEFSLARLARIRTLIAVGGGLQVGLTVGAVVGILALAGIGWRAAVFTGCLVALSSTVIVLKLLADRSKTSSEAGQAALAILLFQDLVVVGMVLLVPFLAGTGAGGDTGGAVGALAIAALIVALALAVAWRVMPPLLEHVARTCSPDIFLLTVVAIGLGTAWLSSLAGLSVSLGAFLAGLVVSESRFSEHAFSELLPLRILFSAVFFVSIGMLLDPAFLLSHPVLVLVAVAGVLAVKLAATSTALVVMGRAPAAAAATALLLAQVGEFSFVLERVGRGAGLFPAGSEALGGQTFIAATVLLMIASPLLAEGGWKLERQVAGHARASEAAVGGTPDLPDAPVIIAGLGGHARALAAALRAAGAPHLIVTLSPDAAEETRAAGSPVMFGDYTRQPILEAAGIRAARMLVVADDDVSMARRVVAVARGLSPEITIVARVDTGADAADVRHGGADLTVTSESAAERDLIEAVFNYRKERPMEQNGALLELRAEAYAAPCAHVAEVRPTRARAAGCEECLAIGDRWVHLRGCMSCGHVGCCDSSKNRHATKHYHATAHPIVRSMEPGDDWAWCYADERLL